MADSSESRTAPERGDNQWPRGTTVALGAAGAIGMVLITISGVAVGPTGPTGSSVERGILTFVPQGTAATVLGATTMTLGLAARPRRVARPRPAAASAAPTLRPLYRITCIVGRAAAHRSADLQPRPLQLRGRRADGAAPHQSVRVRPGRARRVEVPRAGESRVAHHSFAVRTAVPAARERRGAAFGRQRRHHDHDPAPVRGRGRRADRDLVCRSWPRRPARTRPARCGSACATRSSSSTSSAAATTTR